MKGDDRQLDLFAERPAVQAPAPMDEFFIEH